MYKISVYHFSQSSIVLYLPITLNDPDRTIDQDDIAVWLLVHLDLVKVMFEGQGQRSKVTVTG